MNYFPFHIGDYDSNTSHLTWIEDAAYSRMIRLYYRIEKPLPAKVDEVYRLVRASTAPERKAVSQVLNEFFVLHDDGWHNARCDAEIEKAKQKAERNRTVGKLGGRPKKSVTEMVNSDNPQETQTVISGLPNETLPITNNQEPRTKDKTHTEESSPVATEAGAVCVLLRSKGFGTVNPSHQKLLDLLAAGMHIGAFDAAADIAKSKGNGFDYVLGIVAKQLQEQSQIAEQARASPPVPHETPYQRAARERVAEFAPALARKAPASETPAITIIEGGQNVTAIGSR